MDNFSKQIYEAGINDGRAEGISEATIRFIKNTMLSDSCSVDQAMVKLHIPPEEHQYFKVYFVNPNSSKRANKFPVFSKGISLS